jgi:proton-conducting membrane transporter
LLIGDAPEPAASLSEWLATLLLLALVGFGVKAGVVPLHFWLPGAHAAAPSHVSALLSGVMLKMGIYGLLRVMSLLGGAAGLVGLDPAWAGRGLGRALGSRAARPQALVGVSATARRWCGTAGKLLPETEILMRSLGGRDPKRCQEQREASHLVPRASSSPPPRSVLTYPRRAENDTEGTDRLRDHDA